jgi:hypothetical protein
MAAKKATEQKPTLEELAQRLPQSVVGALEAITVRLIQIAEEQRTLEAEKGYKDSATGKRYPGLTDELENLLIAYDLTDTGFRYFDYSVIMMPGSHSYIDADLLLAEGVDPDVINRATVRSQWVGAQVRRNPSRKGKGQS